MAALEFVIGATPSCSTTGAAEYKVQLQVQNISTLRQSPPVALTPPVWTSPTVLTSSPFEFGEISASGAPEGGSVGASDLSLEADNRVCGTISNAPVRMYDLVTGRQSGWTFDTDTSALHVRILRKAAGAGAYTVRYWGIVDFSSIECIMGDASRPDTWKVKFQTVDSVRLLEEYDMVTFVETSLPMTGATTSTAKYLTFLGDLAYGAWTVDEGRYSLRNLRWSGGDASQAEWLGSWQNPRVPDGNSALDPLRYFKIVDVIAAVHDFLGLEAAAVNNGTAWSSLCSWRWYYNDAAPGNRSLVSVTIDELYIVAGVYVYDGTQNVYAHRGTFFDRDKAAPHSLMSKSNPLEMLKDICTSLGLTFRVAVNSSGERYLDVRAADAGDASIDWDADNRWYSDVKIRPYSRRITGVEVVSGQENIARGSLGNESIKVDCMFTTANHIRTDGDFRSYPQALGGGEISVVVGDSPAYAFWSALWAMGGSPTGSNYPGAYTICACAPAMNGNAANQITGGSAPYIQTEQEAGTSFQLGQYLTGTYGGIDFTAGGVSGTVLYPNDDAPVNSWAEVPGMALSHYLYSPRLFATDRVGVYRAKGMEIEITRGEIIGTQMPMPGSRVELILNGVTYNTRLVSISENYLENTTKMTVEYWEI